MKIIKHNSLSPDSIVKVQDFFNDGVTVIVGNWITVNGNDIRLVDGDYILIDDFGNNVKHISLDDYNSDSDKKQQIKEQISKEIMREIWKAMQSASDAIREGILTTITTTLIALNAGEPKAALSLATATATNSFLTAGRKTTLLNILNAGVAKL